MGKITKTMVLGGLIAGALVAFSKTKKGQALHKKLTARAEDLYENVDKKLKKVKKISQQAYDEAVESVVETYADNKGLTEEAALKISKELKARWKEIKKELQKNGKL